MSDTQFTRSNVQYKSLAFMGFPKYRVGDDGSVWSKCHNRWGTGAWKQKKQTANNNGYMMVALWHDGKSRLMLVSRVVLEAFVGPCPTGMEACHFPDKNKSNNRLENLRWGTREDNHKDKVLHGTSNRGVKGNTWKLRGATDELYRLRDAGMPLRTIASRLGVDVSTVCYHLNKRNSQHGT